MVDRWGSGERRGLARVAADRDGRLLGVFGIGLLQLLRPGPEPRGGGRRVCRESTNGSVARTRVYVSSAARSIDPDTEAAGAMDLIVNGVLPAVH